MTRRQIAAIIGPALASAFLTGVGIATVGGATVDIVRWYRKRARGR